MSKKTHLDRAIEQLEAERAVLDLAIAKLQDQRKAVKPRKLKPVRVSKTAELA